MSRRLGVGGLATALCVIVMAGSCLAGPDSRMGFAAGGSLAGLHFANPEFVPRDVSFDRIAVPHAGIRVFLPVTNSVFAETGLWLDGRGATAKTADGATRYSETDRLYYVGLPATIGWLASGRALRPHAYGGCQFGYLAWAHSVFKQDDRVLRTGKPRPNYPDTDWSLLVGVGVFVRPTLSLDATYSWGLSNLNRSLNRDQHHIYNRAASCKLTYWWSF
jgi:hypothetical protein